MKTIYKVCIPIILLLILLLSLLPTLLSSPWGTATLLSYLNKKIPGKVEIEELSLSWQGPQKIKNLTLKKADESFVAHFDALIIDNTLTTLLLKKGEEQNIDLINLKMTIQEEANGSTNLHEALGISLPEHPQQAASPSPMTLQLLDLHAKAFLHSNKQPIQLFLRGKTKQNAIEGEFVCDLLLQKEKKEGRTLFKAKQMTAQITRFPVAIIDNLLSLQHPDMRGAIRTLLGETLDLSLRQKGSNEASFFELFANTPSTTLSSEGQIENGRIKIEKKTTATLALTPSMLKALETLFSLPSPIELLSPTTVTLNLEKIDLPLKTLIEDNDSQNRPHTLIANLETSPLLIKSSLLPEPVKVENLNIACATSQLNKIQTTLSTTLSSPNAQLQKVLGFPLQLHVNTDILIGEENSWDLNPLKITLETPTLKLAAEGSLNSNNTLAITEPLIIKYELRQETLTSLGLNIAQITPNRPLVKISIAPFADQIENLTKREYQITASQNKIELTFQSKDKISFEELSCPITLDVNKKAINLLLCAEKASFQKEKERFAFEKLALALVSSNWDQSVDFQLKADDPLHPTNTPLTLKGSAKDYLSPTKEISPTTMTLDLEATSPNLPLTALCQLAGLDSLLCKKIEALFGSRVNAEIKTQLQKLNGPLYAKIEGGNGKVKLDGNLKEGRLTLNAPFEAQVKVTPELDKSIIQNIIPILSGVVKAEQPIKIKIDSKGFSLPLEQTQWDKITLPKGSIELGKMHFADSSTMGLVFDLLKKSHKNDLSVWFTPLYFNVDRGIITLSRMDMLFMGQYPMAIWGKVAPLKDKVDIRIGIRGQALSKAFGISNLEKDYMMQLPLTGNLSNPSIDKAKAVGRISALVAQSQGTPQRTLFGVVLGIATGEFTEEKAPQPTTRPLPWE